MVESSAQSGEMINSPHNPTRFPDVSMPVPRRTRFFGRDSEIADLTARLTTGNARLITVTGPGGVGKSRLVQEVLARGAELLPPVALIPLDAVVDRSGLENAIQRAAGVADRGEVAFLVALARALRGRTLLLVLDGFEHLADSALVLSELLAAVPGLRLVVTCRVVLRLSGEELFSVEPLSVEPAGVESGAVQLFVDRARSVNHRFTPDPDQLVTIARICERLDGLPLAIELAAARIRLLTPAQIEARLEGGLALLARYSVEAPERQQTMRAAVAWSFDLLTPEAQGLLVRLSLFPAPVSLEFAESLIGSDAVDLIAALIESSLVNHVEHLGEYRFGMLETVRAFGREQLGTQGNRGQILATTVAFTLPGVEKLNEQLHGGADQLAALDHFTLDHANHRVMLEWAVEHDPIAAMRLANGLGWFWYLRGYFTEGLTWFERILAAAPGAEWAERVPALWSAGLLALRLGRDDEAEAFVRSSQRLARMIGDPESERLAIGLLGVIAEDRGDLDTAYLLLKDALLPPSGGDLPLAGLATAHLGVIAWARGDRHEAERWLQEALALHLAEGDHWGAANARTLLALVMVERGQGGAAARHLCQSLADFQRFESSEEVAIALLVWAVMLARDGDHQRAAYVFGAGEELLARIGAFIRPPERDAMAAAREECQDRIGARAFEQEWREGAAVPIATVVGEALANLGDVRTDTLGIEQLSPRELEVLHLLVDGCSDREIAERLFISPRTVQVHVGRVLAKLGVSHRIAAIAVARRQGFA